MRTFQTLTTPSDPAVATRSSLPIEGQPVGRAIGPVEAVSGGILSADSLARPRRNG